MPRAPRTGRGSPPGTVSFAAPEAPAAHDVASDAENCGDAGQTRQNHRVHVLAPVTCASEIPAREVDGRDEQQRCRDAGAREDADPGQVAGPEIDVAAHHRKDAVWLK